MRKSFMNYVEAQNKKRAENKDKSFWGGMVSLDTFKIEETHTAEEAEEADLNMDFYFSEKAIKNYEDGKSAFFYINQNPQINIESKSKISNKDEIIAEIKKQVEIVS